MNKLVFVVGVVALVTVCHLHPAETAAAVIVKRHSFYRPGGLIGEEIREERREELELRREENEERREEREERREEREERREERRGGVGRRWRRDLSQPALVPAVIVKRQAFYRPGGLIGEERREERREENEERRERVEERREENEERREGRRW